MKLEAMFEGLRRSSLKIDGYPRLRLSSNFSLRSDHTQPETMFEC